MNEKAAEGTKLPLVVLLEYAGIIANDLTLMCLLMVSFYLRYMKYIPVFSMRIPVYSLHIPVYSLNAPVYCLHTPVYSLHMPDVPHCGQQNATPTQIKGIEIE